MAYIEFQNVIKEYRTGETRIRALDGAEFTIEKGELAVILGSSGAGKTTALNILGGMDTVTHGHVLIDGTDITAFQKRELTRYRRTEIGFVFQFYNLVPNLTALENVELAAQVCRPDQSGPGGKAGQFPFPAVRRRAAACVDRPRHRQESRHAPV